LNNFLNLNLHKDYIRLKKPDNRSIGEIPFTLAIPASDLNTNDPASHKRENMFEDQTLIQGMIDLWFMEE